jgi:hypothetical protein
MGNANSLLSMLHSYDPILEEEIFEQNSTDQLYFEFLWNDVKPPNNSVQKLILKNFGTIGLRTYQKYQANTQT